MLEAEVLRRSANKQIPKTMLALVILFVCLMVFAMMLANLEWLRPAQLAFVLGLIVVVGVLMTVITIESLVRDHFEHLYGLRYAAILLLALAFHVARLDSLSDINSIFHIDPSALPLTIWVATIANILKLLYWPVILCLVATLLLWIRSVGDSADIKTSVQWVASAVAFAIFLLTVILRLGDQERKEFLYRFAHQSDFVSKFNCEGVGSGEIVGLFIGPEQHRILLAPVIKESPINYEKSPELFRPVKIPERFPVVECISPRIEIVDWLADHNRQPYK